LVCYLKLASLNSFPRHGHACLNIDDASHAAGNMNFLSFKPLQSLLPRE
jgi:hypothetical protein